MWDFIGRLHRAWGHLKEIALKLTYISIQWDIVQVPGHVERGKTI